MILAPRLGDMVVHQCAGPLVAVCRKPSASSQPAADNPSMRVAVLGFGLIGGSLARALRDRDEGRWSIAAWSPSGVGPAHAAADGVIDRATASPEEAIEGADLVVLAAPPLACLDLLDRVASARLPPTAVVTDVASTKRRIVERAAALGLPFIGGHPMAGVEMSGYETSDADLFVGRPWVICAGADAVALARVEALVEAVGGRPMRMDGETHDALVAAISHMPLVVSVALVESVLGRGGPAGSDAMALAAGGWSSMTRLARGDPEMSAGIAATNNDQLVQRVRAVRDVLDDWLTELDAGQPDPDRLRRRFAAARALLE
jgi:prephenate dehydrogenase